MEPTLQVDVHAICVGIALLRKDLKRVHKDLTIKIGLMFGIFVGLIIAAIGMVVRYLA